MSSDSKIIDGRINFLRPLKNDAGLEFNSIKDENFK